HIYFPSTSFDIVTLKYDQFGNEKWAAHYNGPTTLPFNRDHGVSIEASNDGSVYVTGRSEGQGTGFDMVTIKYNSTGSQVWEKRISTLSSAHFEIARKIHCNPDGTVVIGGDNASDRIIILVKYDSTGVMLDSTNYDVKTSSIFFDFTVDNNGNY